MAKATMVPIKVKKMTRGRLFKRKVNGHDTYNNVIVCLLDLPEKLRKIVDAEEAGDDLHKSYEAIADLVKDATGQ